MDLASLDWWDDGHTLKGSIYNTLRVNQWLKSEADTHTMENSNKECFSVILFQTTMKMY